MARQIKKPVVYRRHEIDPSGTGVRCMDVAPIPEVAPSASANTGSPKCLCETCSRLLSAGGECMPNSNSFVTACSGFTKSLRASA